jgi:cytochrome c biogenesis protein CcdA
MNEKLTMTLKWLSYVALFFCVAWFVFLCYQSYHQVFDTTGSHIHWEAKQNQVLFVSAVFILYFLLTLAMIGVCVAFILNTIRGIKNEELFPRKNIRLIFIAALLIFLQTVASDNLSQAFIVRGPGIISLTSNPFVQSLIVLIFGILYKMAHQVAAEHDLTV